MTRDHKIDQALKSIPDDIRHIPWESKFDGQYGAVVRQMPMDGVFRLEAGRDDDAADH